MSKRIKGITIEIGSDTVGLQKALSDVNKKSYALQTELRDVERLLKFNPGNVEAVAQKQRILTEQVSNTTQKLNQLKEAEAQVQEQFRRGDITEEQYRNFRREIEFTEGSLQGMKTELSLLQVEQDKFATNTKHLETLLRATDMNARELSATLGDKLARSILNGSANARQLETAIERIGRGALGADVDIEQLRRTLSTVDDGASIDSVRRDLGELSREASQAEEDVRGLGIEMENVAGALVAGGGLAGAIEAALDVSSLDTSIDITFDVPESSKKSVKEAVRDVETYGVDAGEALEGVRRQWALNKEASDESNAAVVKGAGAIAKAYTQIDFTELIQESNEISKALKISNEESIGLVNALLKVGFPPEQIDIISEYGTQLQMAGYTAEEIQALFSAGIDTGTWNIDNLLDGLKEGRIRVGEFGEEVPKAMKELIAGTSISANQLTEWGNAVSKGGKEGSAAMVEIAKALNGVDNETKKNLIGVQIFGTLYEDQGQNIIDTILNAKDATVDLRKNQELLNETTSRLDEDPIVELKEAGTELKEALEPLLLVLADIISELAEWASENPKLLATIVAIATALGVLVGSIAALAPGFVSLAGAITGAGGAGAVLSGVLTALTGPIGLTIAGIAALGVGAVMLAKHLKEPALEAEIFSDKVSESTQKAVGSYMELDEQANAALNNLAWGQRTVTQEMADGIVETFGQMGDQILAEMQTDHEEQLASMQDFFLQSNVMNAEEEAQALEKMRASQEEKRLSVEDGQKRIQEILSNAVEGRRALTENERAIMATIQEQMKSDAITVMTDNQAEQQAIYEQMKVNASEITAQQAAEVVKQSVKQKNDVVKEANDQYNQSVAAIIKMRDETGAITKDQADNMIREATKQRDQVVARAEETHNDVVKEAKAQAKEHVDEVSWETGEILSKWEVFCNKVTLKTAELGTDLLSKWTGMRTDANRKWEEIKGIPAKKLQDAKVAVNQKLVELTSDVMTQWNKAEAFLDRVDLREIGKDIIRGLINGIGSLKDSVQAKVEEIASGIPSWAKKILGIHSPSRVMMEVGKWTGEGLAVGLERSTVRIAQSTEMVLSEIRDMNHKIEVEMNKQKATHKDILDAQIDNTKNWIQEKSRLNSTSLMDELRYYEYLTRLARFNSSERIAAEKEVYRMKKEIQDKITSLDQEYLGKIQQLNSQMVQEQQRLNEAYQKTLEDRTKSLYSFAGIFDEINLKMGVSGQGLLGNLRDQVNMFSEWAGNIKDLASKGISEGLLEELRGMGPRAAAEIQALTSLSSEELKEYEALWAEKNRLARNQATEELEGLRVDTEAQIEKLHHRTAEQLEQVRLEWIKRITEIKEGTKDEFSDIDSIGVNAVKGIMDGMDSMMGDLLGKAKQIAESVKDALQESLDIHSPSRVTTWMGEMVGMGLVNGMENSLSTIQKMSDQLAEASVPSTGFSEGGGVGGTSSSSNSNRTFNNKTTINIHSQNPSPSEIARRNQQVGRQLAYQWGI